MTGYIPNLITVSRIALAAPIGLFIFYEDFSAALVLFVIASITDGVDGYLARRLDVVSRFGQLVDPLADKLLITVATLMLVIVGQFPVLVLMLLVVRDLAILGGALVYYLVAGMPLVDPTPIGKVTTFLQILLVIWVMLAVVFADAISSAALITAVGLWTIAIVSIASGVSYLWTWTGKLVEDPRWNDA